MLLKRTKFAYFSELDFYFSGDESAKSKAKTIPFLLERSLADYTLVFAELNFDSMAVKDLIQGHLDPTTWSHHHCQCLFDIMQGNF